MSPLTRVFCSTAAKGIKRSVHVARIDPHHNTPTQHFNTLPTHLPPLFHQPSSLSTLLPNNPSIKMQFFTIVAAFAAAAVAAPASLEQRQVPVCTGGNPLCCATDVLNLADLDCATRKCSPTTTSPSALFHANTAQPPPPPPAPTSSSTSAPPPASRPSAASCPSSARPSSAPTSTPPPRPPPSTPRPPTKQHPANAPASR